jgi:DNA-binding FadR family transcriptional regulator
MSMDRRYQLVARQIIELIESGEFPTGSRLPGERELAERLGVSRVTIREAEIALEAQGYLAVKTGSGVYVRQRLPDELTALTGIDAFELTTVRAVIEAESAALAALNMTPAAIALLEETVRVMSGDDEAAEAADERFHILIAENSGSPIIEHFVRILWRMRHEAPRGAQVYGAVLDAIRNRDPNAARLAMREHFSRLFEAMLAAEETEAIVQLRRKAIEHRHRFKLSVQDSVA